MKALSSSKAKSYSPATPAAHAAVEAFIKNESVWGESFSAAEADLTRFVRENVSAKALGYLSSDKLNMSAFGVAFESNPGPGFIAVPGHVAEKLRERGLRGEAYFPDMNSDLGKKMMAKLNAVSRQAEQRPLLNGVAGVSPVAIEDGRVVLSRAVATEHGAVVLAAPTALAPDAEVVPFAAPKAQADLKAEATSAQRRARMN